MRRKQQKRPTIQIIHSINQSIMQATDIAITENEKDYLIEQGGQSSQQAPSIACKSLNTSPSILPPPLLVEQAATTTNELSTETLIESQQSTSTTTTTNKVPATRTTVTTGGGALSSSSSSSNSNSNSNGGPIRLDYPIPYLNGKLEHVEMFYTKTPPIDWMDDSIVRQNFPIRVVVAPAASSGSTTNSCSPSTSKEKLGSRQVPKCLLLDAQNDHDKLIIVNWWRGMTKKQQTKEWEELRLVYRAPTVSNDLLPQSYYNMTPYSNNNNNNNLNQSSTMTSSSSSSSIVKTLQQQPEQLRSLMASGNNNIMSSIIRRRPPPSNLQPTDAENETSNFNMGAPLTKWNFRSISTSQELADKLHIPIEALYCVELIDTNNTNNNTSTTNNNNNNNNSTSNIDTNKTTITTDGTQECNVIGCPYPAILRNRNKCVVHCRQWYPRQGYVRGNRGHLLLGPSHFTHCNKRTDTSCRCICTDKLCSAIGYSDDMIRLPLLNIKLRQQVFQALGIIDVVVQNKDPIQQNESITTTNREKAYIAPWHFHPQHRKMNFDGSWKVIKFHKKDIFTDPNDDNDDEDLKERSRMTPKESGIIESHQPNQQQAERTQSNNNEKQLWIGCPPPTYSIKKFIEEEVRGTPTGRGYFLPKDLAISLPGWVEVYRSKESGPLTKLEVQIKELQTKRLEFCEHILQQEKTIDTLEWENKKLKIELEEVKASKRKNLLANKRKRNNRKMTTERKRLKRKLHIVAAATTATATMIRNTAPVTAKRVPEAMEDEDIGEEEEEDYGAYGDGDEDGDETADELLYPLPSQNHPSMNGYTQEENAYAHPMQVSNFQYPSAAQNGNTNPMQPNVSVFHQQQQFLAAAAAAASVQHQQHQHQNHPDPSQQFQKQLRWTYVNSYL